MTSGGASVGVRAMLVIVAIVVIGVAAGQWVYDLWPRPAGPQNECQFLRWEYQQLWPDGGGPPLPANC